MPEVRGGNREVITLQPGQTMTITSPDVLSSGIVRRMAVDGGQLTGNRLQPIQASGKINIGPFALPRTYSIEAVGTSLLYSIDVHSQSYARQLGDVWGFTGSLLINNEMNGKIMRCEDANPVTVSIPGDLIEGFNCGIIRFAAGSVTLSFVSGAVKRVGGTALGTQYFRGSLFVAKNADGNTAECMVGGDFA